MTMEDLEGRVAVITGGASGIGLAMAQRFAAEGMRLVLADIERPVLRRAGEEVPAELATPAGEHAVPVQFEQDVFEELPGDLLALGDVGDEHGRALTLPGQEKCRLEAVLRSPGEHDLPYHSCQVLNRHCLAN